METTFDYVRLCCGGGEFSILEDYRCPSATSRIYLVEVRVCLRFLQSPHFLSRTSDYCTGHIPSIVQLCYARSHADVVNTIVVLLCRLQDRTIGSLVARTLAWLQRPIASLTQNLRPVTMQVPDTGSEP